MDIRRLSTLTFLVVFILSLPRPSPAQVEGGISGVVVQPRPAMPQPRDRRMQPEKTGTASIGGVVTAAESGAALRRVQVHIAGQELRIGRTAMTDADGRFSVADLPSGRYSVIFSKAGFASTQYGQKRPNQPGQPIALADGQKLENVNASLVRGGVIAGRVYDDFGEPVVDARVSVLQYRWANGRRRLMNMARGGESNDRGEYRIWGLPAGEYYVSAVVADRRWFGEMPGATPKDPAESTSLAATYYPGTAVADEAQRVAVAPGQEVGGVDFNLVTTRTVRVSGTAITSEGKPLASSMVMVMPRQMEGGLMMPQGGQTDASGSFTIGNVAPGEYVLAVRSMFGPGPRGDGESDEIAFTHLTVAGTEDIRNVMIVGTKGVRASGRVIFEGTPPADTLESVNLIFPPAPGEGPIGMDRASNARMKPDRTFEVRGLVGRRLVHVVGLPPGWVIKAVRIGGQDVMESGFEFSKENVSNVEVVVTDRTTTVTGRVTRGEREPAADSVVLAFPTDEEHWSAPVPRRLGTANPDQNGTYRLPNLPPGGYYIVAVEAMPEEWGNPELFELLKDRAKRITLEEGETEALDLVLQPGVPGA